MSSLCAVVFVIHSLTVGFDRNACREFLSLHCPAPHGISSCRSRAGARTTFLHNPEIRAERHLLNITSAKHLLLYTGIALPRTDFTNFCEYKQSVYVSLCVVVIVLVTPSRLRQRTTCSRLQYAW